MFECSHRGFGFVLKTGNRICGRGVGWFIACLCEVKFELLGYKVAHRDDTFYRFAASVWPFDSNPNMDVIMGYFARCWYGRGVFR